jgi:hypothetical protein
MKRLLLIVVLVAACGGDPASPSAGAATPRPVASGEAVVTPSPSPIAAGAGAPATFDTIAVKGKGNDTVTFDIPEDAIGIAAMSHPGKGAFEVRAYDADGNETQVLVKTKGKYKGVVLFDLTEHSVAFKVTAKGGWKIAIDSTGAAKAWDGSKAVKGKGDALIGLSSPTTGETKVAVKANAKGRFALRAHTGDEEVYLVDQPGPYKGTVTVPEDTTLLEIRAKGAWSITPAS